MNKSAAQLDREIAVSLRTMHARKHADYVYQNADDSLRVRVLRRDSGRWDYDVFYPSGVIETYSKTAADDFATKTAAFNDANIAVGPLKALNVVSVVDKAWFTKNKGR